MNQEKYKVKMSVGGSYRQVTICNTDETSLFVSLSFRQVKHITADVDDSDLY